MINVSMFNGNAQVKRKPWSMDYGLWSIFVFMNEEWYVIKDVDAIDSPALVIYAERVKQNIALAIQMVGDPSRLRPHVKTHKSPYITRLMLEAGIINFKCATIAEAEMLAQCGAPDIMLAYQPVGPKISRLLQLVEQYPESHFSCLVDSIEATQAISIEARDHHIVLDVFIDVNVGMNRTGVLPENAIALYQACQRFQGINVVGLHGYDGHINDADQTQRKRRADEAYDMLVSVGEALRSEGLAKPIVIAGGSPTFSIHASRKDVACSPGTFVYWDKSYSNLFPDLGFLPAALVISRVVSILNEKKLCLDLGHKSIAAENALNSRVCFLNGNGLQPVSQSEEHLVVETKEPHHYHVGDVLYGMPYHVCPTCALYDTAYVIEGGQVKEQFQVAARDRKINV
jgi:D-serine deaminase-like pyridoxal phosphate-dependent protein